jgi:hypothetical protein
VWAEIELGKVRKAVAACESFMKTLKYEEVYRNEYRDLAEARASVGEFLEKVYNRKRLHSAAGLCAARRVRGPTGGITKRGGRYAAHQFRHSLSSYLTVKERLDPKTAQVAFRHSNPAFTLGNHTQTDNEGTASSPETHAGHDIQRE